MSCKQQSPSMAPSSLWVVRTVTHGEMAVGGRGSQALPLVGLVLPWQANPTVPNVSSGPQGPHVWQWAFPDHSCEQLSLHPAPGTGSCGRSPWVLASERALPTLVPAEGRPVGGGTEPHSPPAGARPAHLCQVRGWESEALSCWRAVEPTPHGAAAPAQIQPFLLG